MFTRWKEPRDRFFFSNFSPFANVKLHMVSEQSISFWRKTRPTRKIPPGYFVHLIQCSLFSWHLLLTPQTSFLSCLGSPWSQSEGEEGRIQRLGGGQWGRPTFLLPKVGLINLEGVCIGHCKECKTQDLSTSKEFSRGFGNSFSYWNEGALSEGKKRESFRNKA